MSKQRRRELRRSWENSEDPEERNVWTMICAAWDAVAYRRPKRHTRLEVRVAFRKARKRATVKLMRQPWLDEDARQHWIVRQSDRKPCSCWCCGNMRARYGPKSKEKLLDRAELRELVEVA
jgi:hypothetical protein